jgi:hypothetical protein
VGVDARHHDVRLEIQQPGQRQVHAIGRRAGHAPGFLVHDARAQRSIERERIGRARAVAVGSHRDHAVAGVAQPLRQHLDTGRVHPVVVAYQYPHAITPS